MSTREQRKRRPSKDQVRAWLTTVIAPIASALAVEESRVGRGNCSFRCYTQDFEFLWPVPRMVAAPYGPNLEQLLRYRNDVKTLAQRHDDALDNLRTVARTAYNRLLQNDRFRTLARSTAVPETEHRYFAEYVVNGLRDLVPDSKYHDLWAHEGAEFLELRESPELTDGFRSLADAGRSFRQAVASLFSIVSALQAELADTYNLPPVDPVDAVRV